MPIALELTLILVLITITVSLVPLLYQLRRSARALDAFLVSSRKDLAQIAEDAHASRIRMDHLAESLQAGVDEALAVVKVVGDIGRTVSQFNERFHNSIELAVGQLGGIIGGVSTVLAFFKRTKNAHLREQEISS